MFNEKIKQANLTGLSFTSDCDDDDENGVDVGTMV